MAAALTVTVREDERCVVVVASGELDIATAPILRESLERCTRRPVARVVVDLRQVGFIDSTGLRLLLTTAAQATERRIELALLPGEAVTRLLDLTRLRSRFSLADEP